MSTQPNYSVAESLASLSASDQHQVLTGLTDAQALAVLHDWRGFWARPNQLPPGTPGAADPRADWRFWVALAGRGWGKTRVGAETVREWAENPNERILMIAPVAADVREVMIEGPSGLMQCYPHERRPVYNPTRHLVVFPSGAIGITRSADEPERLRGPQFTKFWADELCAWRFMDEAWSQIQFGFRLPGDQLRGIITTTPKPVKILKALVANRNTVVTRGSSYENRSNLSADYFADVITPYEGTRLGRQEINAEILEDVQGALWSRQMIEASRVTGCPAAVRVVIAIDPAVTAKEGSDLTGIVCVALAANGHCYVLKDVSLRASPGEWAKVAITLAKTHEADRIVCEVNNGGDLVASNIWTLAPNAPVRAVRASRGKAVRAEPAAALYERGRVHHVGCFPDLEDQLCSFVPGVTTESPDRMDALVWALYDLVIQPEELHFVGGPQIEVISPI